MPAESEKEGYIYPATVTGDATYKGECNWLTHINVWSFNSEAKTEGEPSFVYESATDFWNSYSKDCSTFTVTVYYYKGATMEYVDFVRQ